MMKSTDYLMDLKEEEVGERKTSDISLLHFLLSDLTKKKA